MRKLHVKHRLLGLLALLMPLFALASPRHFTTEDASIAAARFLKSLHGELNSIEAEAVHPVRLDDNYCVFNSQADNGFVIVSGNNENIEILGYSDTGSFDYDKIPPQLRALLDNYRANNGAKSVSAGMSRSDSESKLLLTANWGQGYPYNLETPMVGDEATLTGCVATAMAIVMKYHSWPNGYDWDSMPMEQPEQPVQSLCRLMADAGESVLMHYGTEESTANVNWVGHRLQQRFKYSPECQLISSENFTTDRWHELLRSNIDNDMPVLYNGTSGSVGHVFVIDGYKGTNYHVNWGWNGYCNGFYDLDALIPSEDQNFSSDTRMVIGIEPDRSGKEYSAVFCDRGYFWTTGAAPTSGAHYSIDSPGKGQTFEYACETLNYPCEESGEIGLLLYQKDGTLREVLATFPYTPHSDDFGLGVWSTLLEFTDVTINSEVSPDDYISLATRKSLSSPWLEVLGTLEAPVKMAIAEIEKKVCTVNIINKIPEAQVSYTRYEANPIVLKGDEETFDCVMGGLIAVTVYHELGIDDVTICIDGAGLYGDQQVYYGNSLAFTTYSGDYTVTIEKIEPGIEQTVEVDEPGTLAGYLEDVDVKTISSLILKGRLNAVDFWYIRDNLKWLEKIDLSDVVVIACEEIDPVEAYRMVGEVQADDCLPTFALTGLERLSDVKLPTTLKHIASNSLMSLAIEKIDFPSGVETIGLNVLFDCNRLNTVIARMPQPTAINDCVFTNTMCPASGVLYVPIGSSDAYRSVAVWQDFAQIIEDDNPEDLEAKVEYEGLVYRTQGNALYLVGYNPSEVSSEVTIPDRIIHNGREYAVYGIDDYAMQNSEIKSFTMNNGIVTIGQMLFTGSTVEKVVMSDNIKDLPFSCIDGGNIESLHLPANAEAIGNSLICPNLRKLHIPARLHSKKGYNGSLGMGFRSLEEITVDPENEEWSIHDGMLFWNNLSYLAHIPNTMSGLVTIPDETVGVNAIEFCNEITTIIFGSGTKTYNFGTVSNCEKVKHIEFGDDAVFTSGNVLYGLPSLESITIKNFITSGDVCFSELPSLKYVYLMNEEPIDLSNRIFDRVNENLCYITSSLNPELVASESSTIYVPGLADTDAVTGAVAKQPMWKYLVDRKSGRVKIEPLIEDLRINDVIVNGISAEAVSSTIYSFNSDAETLEIVVDFTMHDCQKMTTTYPADFNSVLSDAELIITSIIIDPEIWSGKSGDQFTITAKIAPADETESALTWTSSDSSIADVNDEGCVTILREGTCTITVSTTDGSNLSAECMITGQSGIDAIFADGNESADIYDINGRVLKQAADGAYIRTLKTGCYILQFSDRTVKLLKR